MPRRVVCVLLVPSVLAGLLAGVACRSGARSLEERLREALDTRVRHCGVKGASAAVILPDGTAWEGAAGISHGDVEMTPDMAFAVGSITKNMVAALVLQLAEEGRLSLEDPLSRWLPPYPHVDGAITVRQLLNHTSGLFMFWDNQAIWDDLIRERTRVFTPEEVLGYIQEPYFAPGEGHRYSNTNYLLAAMIVTRVTDSTLSAEMRRRFWEPLGLESACLPLEEPYPENIAHVWGDNFEKGSPIRDLTVLPRTSHDSIGYGSSGVFMIAGDLARWTHALFGGKSSPGLPGGDANVLERRLLQRAGAGAARPRRRALGPGRRARRRQHRLRSLHGAPPGSRGQPGGHGQPVRKRVRRRGRSRPGRDRRLARPSAVRRHGRLEP